VPIILFYQLVLMYIKKCMVVDNINNNAINVKSHLNVIVSIKKYYFYCSN